ncbi:MAG: tetratricopeptide repeat protein [Lachnospiraceae bacterium]|nr:tetratricopeptide repeat protein [Lachnospiraceae bacterium]
MDKYEFNIKIEQIKKLTKNGDYRSAMAMADTIDWRRVSSVNLLTLVSEIYEKNRDYAEAKEILKLAYERAPVGKRLLYKLAMLALADDNLEEAEAYYRQFYDIAPDDSRQHILRYMILKAKGAPADQLINSLEQYTRDDLDEHWMYELAERYYDAGREQDAVNICDQIMLMFGIGKYVDRAIDLKVNRIGVPLTEDQHKLLERREIYQRPINEEPEQYDPDADAYQVEKPETVTVEEEINPETEIHQKELGPAAVYGEPEAEAEEEIRHEHIPAYNEPESPAEVRESERIAEETGTERTGDDGMTVYTVNFIVERKSDEDGVEASIKLLKLMHEHTGSQNKVAKIKAEKLNITGVLKVREKLAQKDLIVEQAGDLSYDTIEEIIELIREEPEQRVVILIDNPMQVRKLLSTYPELANLFHVDKETRESETTPKKVVQEKPSAEDTIKTTQEIALEKKMSQEEMDIDDFANYAQEYAESIDCSISGKSKLALYERIEIMEEEGILLTRENAVSLIEEAADAAENPSFGRKLSGMFQPKYDKSDRLILREEHFIKH